ncbi:MAG: F0F1 ATP synthase subunit alpha, partial [Deltaproteobacteria bacterium]
KQVVIIYAAINGFLDDYDVEILLRYEEELFNFLAANYSSLIDSVKDKKKIDDEVKGNLEDALNAFKEVFKA